MTLEGLDLCGGEGGAAGGYIRAGFKMTGVDLKPLGHRYPGTFIQADALEYAREHAHRFDFVHVSPPCQGYSIATAGNKRARLKYARLIPAFREILAPLEGIPYVIENVELARRELHNPILLCGRMFGLGALDLDGHPLILERHRLFESNAPLMAPEHPRHNPADQVAGVYGGARRSDLPNATPADDRYAARHIRHGGYVPRAKSVQEALLGIDWMSVKGLQESIPPAYTEYLGAQIRDLLLGKSAA